MYVLHFIPVKNNTEMYLHLQAHKKNSNTSTTAAAAPIGTTNDGYAGDDDDV